MATISVRVAATGNVDLSTGLHNGAMIDGVPVATGNHVLLPLQASPSQNGIYTVPDSGPASRDPRYSTWTALSGLLVAVQSGKTNSHTLWRSEAAPGGTLDATPVSFAADALLLPTAASIATPNAAPSLSTTNTALGTGALPSATGTEDTAIGFNAGAGVTTGSFNVAVGSGAGAAIGAGNLDIFIGRLAGQNATSSSCIGIGAGALENATGNDNVAVGTSALLAATSATGNVAIGTLAQANNLTSNYNVAIGYAALMSANGNGGNIAIGDLVLTNTTTGYEITAVGHNVLPNNTTGLWHAALGVEALFNNTTGTANTAVGLSALHDNTTGSSNTAVGAGAGTNLSGPNLIQTGSFNTFVGANTVTTSPVQQSHLTLIGAQATAAVSNAVVLGRVGTDVVYAGETVLGPNASAVGAGPAARTVASLPPASAALMGARSFVTDAASPAFLAPLSGGGSVVCPVFCNGTAWVAA